jgi:hypothetical protein
LEYWVPEPVEARDPRVDKSLAGFGSFVNLKGTLKRRVWDALTALGVVPRHAVCLGP